MTYTAADHGLPQLKITARPKPAPYGLKRVYIATALDNLEEFRLLRELLKVQGVSLSFDWTEIPGWPPGTAAGNHEAMAKLAAAERRGVREADLVIGLLVTGQRQRGTHWELGIADSNATPMILVGDEQVFDECAFYQGQNVLARLHRDLLNWPEVVCHLVMKWYELRR